MPLKTHKQESISTVAKGAIKGTENCTTAEEVNSLHKNSPHECVVGFNPAGKPDLQMNLILRTDQTNRYLLSFNGRHVYMNREACQRISSAFASILSV